MKSAHAYSRYLIVAVRIGVVLVLCCLFVGIVWAAGLTDASVDDFGRGSGCYVSQADTGQTAGAIILTPTAGTNFSGTVLDSGWFTESGSILGNGNLLVNEGRVGTDPVTPYAPSRTLEFVATFQNAESQHAGFGTDLNSPPWAIFSTGGGAELHARTDNGPDTELDALLGNSYFGTPHLYRIDWQPTQVVYWIDGVPLVTHTIEFTQTMRPIAMDINTSTISLALNWIRMSNYAPSPCTFTSRVINSGADNTTWTNFTTTVAQPAGTAITFDVRASADNITGTSWQMVTSTTISLTGRYVQYRATLTSTDPLVTPQLLGASFGGSPLAVELKSISAAPTVSPVSSWFVVILIIVGLMLGMTWYRFTGRKKRD